MKLNELKTVLARYPEANVRFLLPEGKFVQAHAHVTEAARIDKRFVDCGGTFREDSICRLQTWVNDDEEHRLKASKLSRILEKAKPVLLSDDLEVDIEHELEYITQFPLEGVDGSNLEVVLKLSTRHTACLAEDVCCPPSSLLVRFSPKNFTLTKP